MQLLLFYEDHFAESKLFQRFHLGGGISDNKIDHPVWIDVLIDEIQNIEMINGDN